MPDLVQIDGKWIIKNIRHNGPSNITIHAVYTYGGIPVSIDITNIPQDKQTDWVTAPGVEINENNITKVYEDAVDSAACKVYKVTGTNVESVIACGEDEDTYLLEIIYNGQMVGPESGITREFTIRTENVTVTGYSATGATIVSSGVNFVEVSYPANSSETNTKSYYVGVHGINTNGESVSASTMFTQNKDDASLELYPANTQVPSDYIQVSFDILPTNVNAKVKNIGYDASNSENITGRTITPSSRTAVAKFTENQSTDVIKQMTFAISGTSLGGRHLVAKAYISQLPKEASQHYLRLCNGESSYIHKDCHPTTFEICIESDIEYTAVATENWVSVEVRSGGIYVEIDKNETDDERHSIISVAAVDQSSGVLPIAINITQDKCIGGDITITVDGNLKYNARNTTMCGGFYAEGLAVESFELYATGDIEKMRSSEKAEWEPLPPAIDDARYVSKYVEWDEETPYSFTIQNGDSLFASIVISVPGPAREGSDPLIDLNRVRLEVSDGTFIEGTIGDYDYSTSTYTVSFNIGSFIEDASYSNLGVNIDVEPVQYLEMYSEYTQGGDNFIPCSGGTIGVEVVWANLKESDSTPRYITFEGSGHPIDVYLEGNSNIASSTTVYFTIPSKEDYHDGDVEVFLYPLDAHAIGKCWIADEERFANLIAEVVVQQLACDRDASVSIEATDVDVTNCHGEITAAISWSDLVQGEDILIECTPSSAFTPGQHERFTPDNPVSGSTELKFYLDGNSGSSSRTVTITVKSRVGDEYVTSSISETQAGGCVGPVSPNVTINRVYYLYDDREGGTKQKVTIYNAVCFSNDNKIYFDVVANCNWKVSNYVTPNASAEYVDPLTGVGFDESTVFASGSHTLVFEQPNNVGGLIDRHAWLQHWVRFTDVSGNVLTEYEIVQGIANGYIGIADHGDMTDDGERELTINCGPREQDVDFWVKTNTVYRLHNWIGDVKAIINGRGQDMTVTDPAPETREQETWEGFMFSNNYGAVARDTGHIDKFSVRIPENPSVSSDKTYQINFLTCDYSGGDLNYHDKAHLYVVQSRNSVTYTDYKLERFYAQVGNPLVTPVTISSDSVTAGVRVNITATQRWASGEEYTGYTIGGYTLNGGHVDSEIGLECDNNVLVIQNDVTHGGSYVANDNVPFQIYIPANQTFDVTGSSRTFNLTLRYTGQASLVGHYQIIQEWSRREPEALNFKLYVSTQRGGRGEEVASDKTDSFTLAGSRYIEFEVRNLETTTDAIYQMSINQGGNYIDQNDAWYFNQQRYINRGTSDSLRIKLNDALYEDENFSIQIEAWDSNDGEKRTNLSLMVFVL